MRRCEKPHKKGKDRTVDNVSTVRYNRGTPEGTRTPDLAVRSRALYPAELPAHLWAEYFPPVYNNTFALKMQVFFYFLILNPYKTKETRGTLRIRQPCLRARTARASRARARLNPQRPRSYSLHTWRSFRRRRYRPCLARLPAT